VHVDEPRLGFGDEVYFGVSQHSWFYGLVCMSKYKYLVGSNQEFHECIEPTKLADYLGALENAIECDDVGHRLGLESASQGRQAGVVPPRAATRFDQDSGHCDIYSASMQVSRYQAPEYISSTTKPWPTTSQ
jgi:hypothetical protein